MRTITRQQVVDIEGDGDYHCSSYSGRGMYGSSCFAISTDESEFHVALVLVRVLGQEQTESMAERLRTDSMGLGVVLYFPGYELAAGAETEEESDESEEEVDDGRV